jgi:hypothetical protein
VYQVECHNDQKELVHKVKKLVSDKVEGRKKCAVHILTEIFGGDKNWLELVEDVQKLVMENRV